MSNLDVNLNKSNETETDINTSYKVDVEKLKLLKKEIESLQENEHLEILKIINKSSIKYSENKNGIFINMNKLSGEIINEIKDFLDFCRTNKMKLQNDIIRRDNISKSFQNYN